MLVLVIFVDHLSLVLILRCPSFLLLLMSLMTLMMSEPPGFQSSYETFRKKFVPSDTYQISKQFEENPPWPCLQVFWLFRPIYTTENFGHGSDKNGTRTENIGSAGVNFAV